LTTPPPFDVDFFIMPSWREDVFPAIPLRLGSALGINKATKHPDEVAAFLDYYFNKKRVSQEVKVGRFHPVTSFNIDGVQDIDQLIIKVYKELDNASSIGITGYTGWTFFAPSVQKEVWENIDSVLLGKITINDYLNVIDKSAKEAKRDGLLFNFR
jgi:raffinose/stachyose/melibiose transport system substrate-binding protein